MTKVTFEHKTTGNFQVYRASAGSGKTYALVRLYILCCLKSSNPQYFRHILAITFTNKAAAEMKGRVVKAIESMSNGGDLPLLKDIAEASGKSEEETRNQLKLIHKNMLHRYGDLAVMTIDKFVNGLVRSFAKELGLNAEFKLELDQGMLISKSVSALMDLVGEDEELTRVLEKYVVYQIEEDKSWNIGPSLEGVGSHIFQERMFPVLDYLKEKSIEELLAVQKKLLDKNSAVASTWISIAKAHEKLISDHGMEEFIESNYQKKLAKIAAGALPDAAASGYEQKLYDGELPMKAAGLKSAAAQQFRAQHENELCAFYQDYRTALADFRFRQLLGIQIYQMAVLSRIRSLTDQVLEEDNLKTISDLNNMISRLVRNNPVPFIFERTGQRYHHLLIDEFQDTSVSQWQNLMPLFEESLSNNQLNVIVGDGKQAIYRWRNGDVEQFQQMPRLVDPNPTPEMLGRAQVLAAHHRDVYLGTNYRSTKTVVEFNNALYDGLKPLLTEEQQTIFHKQAQDPKKEELGWIRVEKIEGPRTGDREQLFQQRVIEDIEELTEAGVPHREITVLFRNNKGASSLARTMIKKGITPITEESLIISRHSGVLAVINYLKYLVQPADQKAIVAFLTCLNEAKPFDEPLSEIYKSCLVGEGKKKRLEIEGFLQQIYPELKQFQLQHKSVYEFVERVSVSFGLTEQAAAYAEALLQMVADYDFQEGRGLRDFLRFWDRSADRVSVRTSEDVEGVRLMTIHKAKGLEFGVVLVYLDLQEWTKVKDSLPVPLREGVGLDMAILPKKNGVEDETYIQEFDQEVNRRLLDDMNLFYVATTRAVHGLHVYLPIAEKGGSQKFARHVWDWVQNHEFDELTEVKASIGSPKKIPSKENETQLEMRPFESSPFSDKLKISFEQEDTDSVSSRAFGDEVHGLLSRCKTVEDVKRLEQQQPWMRLSKQDWLEIVQTVRNVVEHPSCQHWFDPKNEAISEQELLDAKGEVLRPDKVVLVNGEMHVIDFKTGEERSAHLSQVSTYMAALEGIKTTEKIKGWLVYTNPVKVIPVVPAQQMEMY